MLQCEKGVRMKKNPFLAAAFAALFACSLNAKSPNKTLNKHAMEIIGVLREIAATPEYIEFQITDAEVLSEVSNFAKGSGKLQSVYEVSFSKENLLAQYLADSEYDNFLEKFPPNIKTIIEKKLFAALPQCMNGQNGFTFIAATSICQYSKTFLCKNLKADTAFLYVFSEGNPIYISFIKGDDGTVLASGTFLALLDEQSEKLQEYLGIFGATLTQAEF